MSTLKSYLTTIADAIREKKGTTEPINAKNFASEILSIQGGGSLNVAYSLTPPTDTSKIWLQCDEPQAVEVQNYLGECAVSEVANWGVISNPVSSYDGFSGYGYFKSCYIGNNQIAIVGYNHIRIFDLTSKGYIADYTINVGTGEYYSNVLYKDNVLYFGYTIKLYSFDLSTQTLNSMTAVNMADNYVKYIFFHSSNEIDTLVDNQQHGSYARWRCKLSTSTSENITSITGSYFNHISTHTIKVNNTVYNFYMNGTDNEYYAWKYNLLLNKFTSFTSFINFINELGWTIYYISSVVYDGERFVYLAGGNRTYNEVTENIDLIIRYDVINDTFELLGQKLIGTRTYGLNELINNRVYMFGGNSASARRNYIDYFDISYPLTQNNAIITTNTINTDNALPLINTDKLKLNSNIASAYKGNANNLAEKVNAYYWNGSKWVGINCDDYVESESSGTGGGLNGGGGDVTTDPEIPVDKPVEI